MEPIVTRWSQGQPPSAEQWQRLIQHELADSDRAAAWQLSSDNVRSRLSQRAQWLLQLRQAQPAFPIALDFAALTPLLWQLWLPLCRWLIDAQQAQGRPLIQGILGGQGTGKTTLTQSLQLVLAQLGRRAVCLSLDDLYLTYAERRRLRAADPRLIWRGPPGTHDIQLGIRTLTQLNQPDTGQTIAIPRFDKSLHQGEGDRAAPELVSPVDFVLFEGWFVGLQPIDPAHFELPPDPICTPAEVQFALDMNQQLHNYLPLWQLLDRLIVLYPQDYRLCQRWRQQAEQAMQAAGKSGMSAAAVEAFVTYFWRALHPELFVTPLLQRADSVDLVIEIGPDHAPCAVYIPKSR
ncbi:MAG: glycerate kinase [Leptolyngbya sp. SIO4C1]|nr:glycerate kinase [Leptolyngbya sp. SIO4C1]